MLRRLHWRRLCLWTRRKRSYAGVTVVRDGNFVASRATVEIASGNRGHQGMEIRPPAFERAIRIPEKELSRRRRSYADPARRYRLNRQASQPLSPTASDLHLSYIAHVPLEPRARLRSGMWTMSPSGQARSDVWRTSEVAEAFRIPEDHVRVLMPDNRSAMRKAHRETLLRRPGARAAKRPVKVVWSREEESLGVLPPAGSWTHLPP